jgi:hypothetical protein
MSRRVGFIVNPLSHTVKRHGSVLEKVSAAGGGKTLMRLSDFGALPAQIQALAEDGVSALFVEGGDGTLQAVLTTWAALAPERPWPDFAILAGGSTNLAHNVMGFGPRTPKAVAAYIARYKAHAAPRHTLQHALKVESAALAQPQIGMLLSTGALARTMLFVQRELHGDGRRGSWSVAQATALFALNPRGQMDADGAPLFRASALKAEGEGFSIQGEHTLSLMTALPALSLGLKPFWNRGGEPLAFTHAQWPIRTFQSALLKVLTGATGPHMQNHGIQSFGVARVALRYNGPLVLDGEVLPAPEDGRIKVSATPPIRFLR